jgi:hypothetical protein
MFAQDVARLQPNVGERCRLEQIRVQIVRLQQLRQPFIERRTFQDIVEWPGEGQKAGRRPLSSGR